jgi:serine/threonine protein kinase
MQRQRQIELLAACDLWSIGHIFSDLAQMQRKNCAHNRRRRLFGQINHFSDLPLKVFNMIGYPTESEIADIENDNVRNYISLCVAQFSDNVDNENSNTDNNNNADDSNETDFQDTRAIKKLKFIQKRFAGTNADGISLVQSLLTFDYKKRITISECIKHPYFDRVRDVEHLEYKPTDIQPKNEIIVYGYFRILNTHLKIASARNEIPFRVPPIIQSLVLSFYSKYKNDSCQQELHEFGSIQLNLFSTLSARKNFNLKQKLERDLELELRQELEQKEEEAAADEDEQLLLLTRTQLLRSRISQEIAHYCYMGMGRQHPNSRIRKHAFV